MSDEDSNSINMEVRDMILQEILPAWEATGKEPGVESEDGQFMVSAGLIGSIIRDSHEDIISMGVSEDFETGVTWAFNVILHVIRATGDRVMPLYVQDILDESGDVDE